MTKRSAAARCAHCHAPLEVPPGAQQATCSYCGHQTQLRQEPKAPPSVQVTVAAPQVNKLALIIPLIAVALTTIMGAVGFLLMGGQSGATGEAISASVGASSTQAPEVITWQGAPALCSIEGDGTEDVIGLFRRNDDDGKQRIYAGAFRGADLERVWEAGPFGDTDKPTQYTRIACADDTVVVADFRGTVRAYDVSSGEKRWSFSVTDRVDRLCADAATRQVFVEVVDEAHKLVDLGVGRAEDAEHPDFCPPLESRRIQDCGMRGQFRDGYGNAECQYGPRKREWDGLYADYVLVEGETRVLLGYKKPGTRTPMAAGVRDGELSWTREIPRGDLAIADEGSPDLFDLVDGVLYVHYESGDDWHLTAIDAETGDRIWNTLLAEDGRGASPRAMVISGCRIYVWGWWLAVLAKENGAYVGSLGWRSPDRADADVPTCELP